MNTFGKIAYGGYCGYSERDPELSARRKTWEELPIAERAAWDTAGIAVLNFLMQQQTQHPSTLRDKDNEPCLNAPINTAVLRRAIPEVIAFGRRTMID